MRAWGQVLSCSPQWGCGTGCSGPVRCDPVGDWVMGSCDVAEGQHEQR